MPTDYRECPQCGEAIEGRPNKKFCSDTCKGRYFRDNNSLTIQSDSPVDTPIHSVRPTIISHYPAYTSQSKLDEEEEWEKEETEERRLAEHKHATKLHEKFCGLVRDFLEAEGKALDARQANQLLEDTADLAAAYITHPYIKLPSNLVNNRLEALYDIHDILQEVSQEIESKLMLWQSKESDFEITKTWRKVLRKLLIPD